MLKLIFIQPRRAQEPFLLRWQPHREREKKKALPLLLRGVFSQRQSQVAAATTAWESQRAIWKAKWVIDDRSQLSPRGSVRGGCAGRASHTTHLWLTINKCGHQPSQTGKHWRQSTWQAGHKKTPVVFFLRLHSISKANSLEPDKINALKNTFLHFSVTSYDLPNNCFCECSVRYSLQPRARLQQWLHTVM